MFGDKIKLTELDSQIEDLERKRRNLREEISQRTVYYQFVCCKKCEIPLLSLKRNCEYSEVEIALDKHNLECKGISNSSYTCVKCKRDLTNIFNSDKKYPPTVYRFRDKVFCEDCGLAKKNEEENIGLNK